MARCQFCKADEPEWICQPFGPDDKPVFVFPGSHYRGFLSIKCCDACKSRVEAGQSMAFTHKGQKIVLNKANKVKEAV